MKRITIKGISTQMKNNIRQWGNEWILERVDTDGGHLITTTIPVHAGGYPYSQWAYLDKDFVYEEK